MNKTQEAFLEIAEAYLAAPSKRNREQGGKTKRGLCYALEYGCHIPPSPLGKIKSTHCLWLPILSQYSHRREHDIFRGTFCLLMALMPETDFIEIWGGE